MSEAQPDPKPVGTCADCGGLCFVTAYMHPTYQCAHCKREYLSTDNMMVWYDGAVPQPKDDTNE